MSKKEKAETRGAEDIEQEFSDALGAVVASYVNIVHKDRATRILALQGELIRADENWTTYEGGPTPPEPVAPPTLTSLDPDSAVAGSVDDITLRCIGTGFTTDSIIMFNNLPEPTTWVSETEVTTGVKPSLFVVPAVCPVSIHTTSLVTDPIDFTFTEEVVTRSKKGK